MVQLKTILDTRKSKSDNTYPIYYRVTEKKKVFYLYSGFSIPLTQWDEQKCIVKKAHVNAQTINASISKRFFEIQKAAIELEDEGIFSLDSLKSKLAPKPPTKTVKEFSDVVIAEMFTKGRTGNAIVYQTGVNSLFKYKPSKALRFTDITTSFIEKYREWLLSNGCKINTAGNYLRTIRAIYNKAIKLKLVDKKYYPFNDITIKTEKTAKRAFSKEVLKNIELLVLPVNSPIEVARDFYMLSFYLIGINFTDIAYLKSENICNGRLEYKRRKTGKKYSIKIQPQAQILFDKYATGDKYLFRILPADIIENSLLAKRLIQQWIKTTNKYLKRISTIIFFRVW